MNLGYIRDINLRRCNDWHSEGINGWSLSDWATATVGELGEACNIIKKLNRVRDNLIGNIETEEELRSQLADEIADTFIYLDLLAAAAYIDLDEAVKSKFNRTSVKLNLPHRL